MKSMHELTAEEIKVLYKKCTEVAKQINVDFVEKITDKTIGRFENNSKRLFLRLDYKNKKSNGYISKQFAMIPVNNWMMELENLSKKYFK